MNVPIVVFILGKVLQVEALFMALPAFVALCYQESAGWSFLVVGVVEYIVGWLIVRKKPQNTSFYAKEGFVTVSLSWILLGIVGAIPFTLNGDINNYLDAIFETVSGFTTTGASILSDVESLNKCSLFWRSFTHWVGGMGVLVFVLSILPLAGAQNIYLMRAESPGPSVGKLVPKIKSTAANLYKIYLALTVLEMIFLLIGGMDLFSATAMSFATAGTGGFGILNDSCASYSSYIQIVITVFMILFGVNFSVYYLILTKKAKQALKSEELRWYLIIIFMAIVGILINMGNLYGNLFENIKHVAFTVASIITTTGYATVNFDEWPQFSKAILVLLMFVGASAGSTGGGLKVSRIVIYFKSVCKVVEQYLHPRSVKVVKFEGKQVEHEIIRGVHSFLITFVFIFAVSALIISLDNHSFATNFTAVAATINNIGPGLELVGPTQNFDCFSPLSKIVLILDMLIGRLEIFPVLLLFAPSTYKR